ncbi:hypothetical protein PTTG_06634 [Puccinia triticina 1-1 BBBD Race 1]|uniref:Uncharacterized protein n=1 Tax=Puccinia triticina (isolate 1-1 / race 1 (BBBD)) TaxID=630390 RepID=A0A0C4F0L7_PUCT1|nr:hypothetical protein PTTG_06634 [Puccinia triticina 1-1 BBBD Race 1]WAR52064.1 hypothetical protein PtB15_1B503 [Puccinia triticina]
MKGFRERLIVVHAIIKTPTALVKITTIIKTSAAIVTVATIIKNSAAIFKIVVETNVIESTIFKITVAKYIKIFTKTAAVCKTALIIKTATMIENITVIETTPNTKTTAIIKYVRAGLIVVSAEFVF